MESRMEPRGWLGHDLDDGELMSVEEEEEEPSLQYFKVLLLYLFKAHRTGIRSPKLQRES